MKRIIVELSITLIFALTLICCYDSPNKGINNEIIDQPFESIAIDKGNIERTGVFDTKPPLREFKIKWKVKINHGTQKEHLRFYDRPIAAGSTVYIASGILHAIDINSGLELWSIPGKSLECPVIYKDTEIYTVSSTGNPNHLSLFRISSAGEIVWQKLLPFSYLTPEIIVNNDILYIVADNYVLTLDAYSGEKVWDYTKKGFTFHHPAMKNHMLYFPASTKESDDKSGNKFRYYLIAVDANKGKEIWCSEVLSSIASTAPPAISDDKIYFGDGEFTFYCLNAKTGKTLWTFKLKQKVSYMQIFSVSASPVIWNNRVYFRTADRYLYCLDAIDGKELWNVELKDTVFSCPALCDGVLYVAEGDYMTSFNPLTGERIWKVKIGPVNWSSPYIYDGKIFIGCDDGYLYCLE